MTDPRTKAAGNITSERIDLLLIADLVAPASRVLDIGCGEGALLNLLVERHNVNARGLELSQAGVNACVAKGLSVVQGDADKDLSYYPDNGFDTVILSQTLQATQKPHEVLREMARIGKNMIISIPNFGHWSVRLDLLLHGRMPKTNMLSATWYETSNIHFCTIKDFINLCAVLNLKIEHSITLTHGRVRQKSGRPPLSANLFAELAVFVLTHA